MSTLPCRFFLAGNCRNGYGCRFHHDGFSSLDRDTLAEALEDYPHEMTTSSATRRSQSQASATSSPSSSSSSSSAAAGSASNSASRPAYAATRPCHWYMAGYCLRGDSCWFSHDRAIIHGSQQETIDLSDDDELDTATEEGAAARPTVHTFMNSANADDEEDNKCAICFEEPSTFGLLVSCNHAFCLTCIRTWRSKEIAQDLQPYDSTNNNVSVTKACPNCRTPSLYVVPSSYFPTCPEQKDFIIQNYKEAAGRKKCKYFQQSGDRHWCPFGDGCFFAHLDENGEPCTVNPDSNPRRQYRRRQTARRGRPLSHSNFMQARRNLLAARRDLLTALQASQSSATVVDLDDFESLLMQMTRLRIDLDNERDSWNETRSTLQRRQQHADTLIDDHGFMYDWSLDRDGDDDFNFDYRDFEGDNNDDDDDDDDDNDDGGGSYPHYRDDGFDNVHDISEWGIPVWTELE